MLKPIWIGKYRYLIVDTKTGAKHTFDSVIKQAENHAKVLEMLLDAQLQIDKLLKKRGI